MTLRHKQEKFFKMQKKLLEQKLQEFMVTRGGIEPPIPP